MEIKLTSNCKLTSKVQIMWFATHIYCERISPIYLNSTPIAEHVNFTLCKFQLYNTVLSTIVTKIYINPSKYSFLNCILYYWVPRKKQCSVLELKYTHTHTHTHIYIYKHIFSNQKNAIESTWFESLLYKIYFSYIYKLGLLKMQWIRRQMNSIKHTQKWATAQLELHCKVGMFS